MTAMRVLHVSPYGPEAWAYGGIPRVVGAQLRGLAEESLALTLATSDAYDASSRLVSPQAPSTGCARVVFRNRSNWLAYHAQFFTPRGLRRWLTHHAAEFDLAHVHACHHLPGALTARAFARLGRPYVVQPNGTAERIERRHLLKRIFDLTLGRGVLSSAARVVAVSAAERQRLERLGIAAARLVEVPNPIETREFATPAATRRSVRPDGGGPRVLFLGRLTPRKRADLLVRAFARLDPPGGRLVIAGNDGGGLAAARREVRRQRLGDRVDFPGLLVGEERLAALAAADVVVYPSKLEVFGLVAAEAILCGTPVVVSDDDGCGELVRAVGGGRLFRAGDAADLTRVLSALLASPDEVRRELPAARERLLRDYSGRAVAARLMSVYRETLSP
jgi:glycosyltransferase involved in cell wall biosynthesis